MATTAARWRTLSDQLTATIDAVPADRWDDPSPCEDWRARDVVGHLVEWMPGLYLSSAGLPPIDPPSVETDPGWRVARGRSRRLRTADRPRTRPASHELTGR